MSSSQQRSFVSIRFHSFPFVSQNSFPRGFAIKSQLATQFGCLQDNSVPPAESPAPTPRLTGPAPTVALAHCFSATQTAYSGVWQNALLPTSLTTKRRCLLGSNRVRPLAMRRQTQRARILPPCNSAASGARREGPPAPANSPRSNASRSPVRLPRRAGPSVAIRNPTPFACRLNRARPDRPGPYSTTPASPNGNALLLTWGNIPVGGLSAGSVAPMPLERSIRPE